MVAKKTFQFINFGRNELTIIITKKENGQEILE